MAKKIEVITKDGKIIRVMPHMMGDLAKFEVTQTKRTIKDVPKELIKPVKVDTLPKMETVAPVIEQLPPMEVTKIPVKRKQPVKSRSTK